MITIRQQSSSGEELFGGGPEEVEADVSAAPVSQTKHKQNSADDDNAEVIHTYFSSSFCNHSLHHLTSLYVYV